MRWRQPAAVAIAETQLAILAKVSGSVLARMIGTPTHTLVMGEDKKPYRVTTTVLRQPDGALRAYVSVDGGGWNRTATIVRARTLSPA